MVFFRIFKDDQGISPQMEKHQNTQPFIVAKGESKESIDRFSIMVDNNEICVSFFDSFLLKTNLRIFK